MKRILIMDLSSRTTKAGGEARIVQNLFEGLKAHFKTYYLGFPTYYVDAEGSDKIILKKVLPVGAWTRRLGLSEISLMRKAYNLVFVRRMKHTGLGKSEMERLMKISPDIVISNSVADFPLLENLRTHGMEFKAVYIDHGSVSTIAESRTPSEGSIPLKVGAGITGAGIKEMKKKFFSFFDLCVALNKNQYMEMKHFTDRVIYIPNGLNVGVKKDRTSLARFKDRYSLNDSNFTILYLGRMFERQKRVSTLISAFRATKDKGMRLVLAGEGPSFSAYVAQARGDDRIVFTGALRDDQISDAYCVSDLFVLPSAWEGFSLVILEAAAHAIPMILSTGAYIEDLRIKRIGNIPNFKTGDRWELETLIKKLHNEPALRKKAIESSRVISREFTRKRMLDRYTKAINSIS